MLAAGTAHFLVPDLYARTVPRGLPGPHFWVQASGAAELAGSLLLALPRTRRLGAWWVACLLVALFPANVQMALDGGLRGEPWPLSSPVVTWVRLPLQVPLVLWALSETGTGSSWAAMASARRARRARPGEG